MHPSWRLPTRGLLSYDVSHVHDAVRHGLNEIRTALISLFPFVSMLVEEEAVCFCDGRTGEDQIRLLIMQRFQQWMALLDSSKKHLRDILLISGLCLCLVCI